MGRASDCDGVQIKAARALLGWSRDRLAPQCGITASTLSAYEHGTRAISQEHAEALRRALEVAGVVLTSDGVVKIKR